MIEFNNKTEFKIDKNNIKRAIIATLEHLGESVNRDVSVAIVGEDEIRELNKQYRGIDKVTDVLSFPMGEDNLLGDIVICYARAREQAEEIGQTIDRELAFLAVHSTLHLMGFDHEDKLGEDEMFRVQEEIVKGCWAKVNKAIFLDIDGVILGSKIGVNTPLPSIEVCDKLREIHKSGVPICLCTARAPFAIEKIVNAIELNGLHIMQNGGVISDLVTGEVLQKCLVEKNVAQDIIRALLNQDVYVEFITCDHFFVQSNQNCDMTARWGVEPVIAENLIQEVIKQDIVGVIAIGYDIDERKEIENILDGMNLDLEIKWTKDPKWPGTEHVVMTPKGTSKIGGVKTMANRFGVQLKDCLAVGDTLGDWGFMELCGYVATVGNGDEELKRLVRDRGGFMGGDVDDNGVLGVLDWYLGE